MIALISLLVIAVTATDGDAFDCAWRSLAFDYAKVLQPGRGPSLSAVSDALQLGALCNQTVAFHPRTVTQQTHKQSPSRVFYVEPGTGRTIQQTLDAIVDLSLPSAKVVLRAGTHYLHGTTITMTPKHNGVTLLGEGMATISGGVTLEGLTWAPHNVANGKNIWVTDISAHGYSFPDGLPGLTLNGMRAFRAKYPNCDPETTVPGCRVAGNSVIWTPPRPTPDPTYIDVGTPQRDWMTLYQNYTMGIGGPCAMYDPPASYWCSKCPRGCNGDPLGGPTMYTPRAPSGVGVGPKALPNLPYPSGAKDAIFNVYIDVSRWFSLMWNTSSFNGSHFEFDYGGFQGCEGADVGSDFFIENVMEELDFPNEYFYEKRTGLLYLYYNATSGVAPPADTIIVAAESKVLLSVVGDSMQSPIRDITIQGITFTSAAATYLDPHGIPSGGDWSLQHSAAVFLEYTEYVTIDGCLLVRLDGNAIMVSKYNRNTTISNNEIAWTGDTAIALWGYTDDMTANGIDGTDGNQPHGVVVSYNLIREVGLYQKQSSFFFQAKSCLSRIIGNIMFNTPRAGINFNDGFGGGSEIYNNLLFNTCRDTSDHGPFNSWDRTPYLTLVYNGTPSLMMKWNNIHRNFMVANYLAQGAIDNDDGSAYYHVHSNFFVYGQQGLKSDFAGHDIVHERNIYAYPSGVCMGDGTSQLPGHEDGFMNNTCIISGKGSKYAQYDCNGNRSALPVMGDNKVYTLSGQATECGVTVQQYQGPPWFRDKGTTVATLPAPAEIIGWAKDLLQMP